MSKRLIYKYEVQFTGEALVAMPQGAEILSAGVQNGHKIVVWASVDPLALPARRRFYLRGTGHEMPPDTARYIGTVHDAPYYWHIFDGGDGPAETKGEE